MFKGKFDCYHGDPGHPLQPDDMGWHIQGYTRFRRYYRTAHRRKLIGSNFGKI